MDIKYIADVKLFHDKFGLTTPDTFTFLPPDLEKFRTQFFYEELSELREASVIKDLPGAVDALVDLIYIIAGAALLHGLNPQAFTEQLAQHTGLDEAEGPDAPLRVYDLTEDSTPIYERPQFIAQGTLTNICDLIEANIEDYSNESFIQNAGGIKRALFNMWMNVFILSSLMGISEDAWNELWDDVQRANMSKERAKKASDSKRGSQWDVIKPKGWVPPQTEEILGRLLAS